MTDILKIIKQRYREVFDGSARSRVPSLDPRFIFTRFGAVDPADISTLLKEMRGYVYGENTAFLKDRSGKALDRTLCCIYTFSPSLGPEGGKQAEYFLRLMFIKAGAEILSSEVHCSENATLVPFNFTLSSKSSADAVVKTITDRYLFSDSPHL